MNRPRPTSRRSAQTGSGLPAADGVPGRTAAAGTAMRRAIHSAAGSAVPPASPTAIHGDAARARAADPASVPSIIPTLQNPWQVFMISRPPCRSIRSALTFIASSRIDIVMPVAASASASPAGLRASTGSTAQARNSGYPASNTRCTPSHATTRPAKGRVSAVPTGSPSRHSASAPGDRPSAALTSGMQGSQAPKASGCRAK